MNFSGVYTALVTPFDADGTINEETLKKLVEWQIESGIAGIVPMGTTGESPTLSSEEHMHVIEIVVEQARGRVPIIAGTGSNSTTEAIEMTRHAAEIGIDASLQVAPYYNKPTQEGFYRHFAEIANSVDIPLVIYNIPSRTGKNIENETMLRLAAHANIQAVKEASGDFKQIMDLVAKKPDTLTILSGDDNIAYPMVAVGASGLISVASNLYPKRVIRMIEAALAGDIENARAMHYQLLSFFSGLFLETNPIPIKYAMSRSGLIAESYRLPMCPMNSENKAILDGILETIAE
jgi:4-hydroxy-tetrahydrodipicolinate synthase